MRTHTSKSSLSYALWSGCLVLALTVSACEGCDDKVGDIAPCTAPLPPTLNAMAGATNEAVVMVGGTRSAGAEILVEFVADDGSVVEQSVVPPGPVTMVSGTFTLPEQGDNTVRFFARAACGLESPRTADIVITLDNEAPAAPTLKEEPPPCVSDDEFVLEGTLEEEGATLETDVGTVEQNDRNWSVTVPIGDDGATVTLTTVDAAGNVSDTTVVEILRGITPPTLNDPSAEDGFATVTGDITFLLEGSKSPNTGILIRKEGEDVPEFIVDPNASTDWSFELDLQEGDNTFFLLARDINGEDSCVEIGPVTITQSSICPPVVTNAESFPLLTNNTELPVELTRCEGVTTFSIINSGDFDTDGVEFATTDQPDAVSGTVTLTEGTNSLRFFNRDEAGEISPLAGPFTIELDTIPPNPPVYNPVPGEIETEPEIEVRGEKDAEASVCHFVEPNVDCNEVVGINPSESFSFDMTLLTDGQQPRNYCIASRDEAGNLSDETCTLIEKVADNTPNITILEPSNGQVIGDDAFTIRAAVTSEVEITEVEICFPDEINCARVTEGGDPPTFDRTVVPNGLENGTSYPVTVRATVRGGGEATASINVFYVVDGFLISDTGVNQDSSSPQVTVDGNGNTHIVWQDNCSQVGDCGPADGNIPADIFHRMFDENGWSDITVLSDDEQDAESENPDIVADADGNVHVIWDDNGNINGALADIDLIHRIYDIEAGTWGPINIVSRDSNEDDRFGAIAAGSDGSIHAVWERGTFVDTPDDVDVIYAQFNNGAWGDTEIVSTVPGNNRSVRPDVAADSTGAAYIVWQDDGDMLDSGDDRDVFLRVFTGGAFTEAFLVTDSNLDGNSFAPKVSVSSDDRVHIAWEDTSTIFNSGDDLDIFYRSFLMGDGFEGNYSLVSTGADEDSQEISLATNAQGDDIFIAWIDLGIDDDNDPDVFYTRGFVGIFDVPFAINGPQFSDLSEYPSLSFDGTSRILHITWEDSSIIGDAGGDIDVYYLGVEIPE